MEVRIYPRVSWLDSPTLRKGFVPEKLSKVLFKWLNNKTIL